MIRTNASVDLLETLETRTLFAATPPDTILVRGTDSSDLITLNVSTDSNGVEQLRATINGRLRKFDLTGIVVISVEARDGNDQVFVDSGVTRGFLINGGLGDDSIIGGAGKDRMIGGRGKDTLQGNSGNDFLRGDGDNDLIMGNSGNDRLDGGDGNDFITGGNGADTIIGGKGQDQMYGQNDNDSFFAEDGEMDTLSGGSGSNVAETIDIFIDARNQMQVRQTE